MFARALLRGVGWLLERGAQGPQPGLVPMLPAPIASAPSARGARWPTSLPAPSILSPAHYSVHDHRECTASPR